jgi:hypothetical protein
MPLLAPQPLLLPALAVLPGVLPWQMLPLLLAGTLVPSLAFMSGGGTSSSGSAGAGGGGGSSGGGSSGSPGQLPPAQASPTGARAKVLTALAAYAKLVWPLPFMAWCLDAGRLQGDRRRLCRGATALALLRLAATGGSPAAGSHGMRDCL